MAEPLCFGQVRLPTLQLLGQLFLLSHIHGSADNSFQDPVRDDRDTDTTDVAKLTAGPHDPFL